MLSIDGYIECVVSCTERYSTVLTHNKSFLLAGIVTWTDTVIRSFWAMVMFNDIGPDIKLSRDRILTVPKAQSAGVP